MLRNNIVTFINQVILHLLSIGIYIYLTEIFPLDYPDSKYTNAIYVASICVIFFLYIISAFMLRLKNKWYKNFISILMSFPVTVYFLYLYYWNFENILEMVGISLVPMIFLWLVLQFKQLMYNLMNDTKVQKVDVEKSQAKFKI
ncbi:hypothetical protein [Clostridium cellulovorans]|uniref:Uncharacterized protein n=1 Tax=Clostridium cellulovorans (strain ATCC 35296 / DSM 3052 / OCM 3 / 743B) TaxID=573061 RepID=D9SL04_CLOC7|nr:hypothetical protein [Clostridium cellulovorans]ADL53576.1 hypothetical protein Clocel_3910 [Clostridium cellulovorans 743B]